MDDTIAITPSEAARRVGISRTKLYELLASGEVPSFTLGRARRIPVDGLREFVKRAASAANADGSQETDRDRLRSG